MLILVTGGTGYIGSHICTELLNAGYQVIVADNLSNSKIEVIDRIKEITSKDLKFYKADLLDSEKFEIIFKENKIDAVIHLAGLKSVSESINLPIKYYENNVTGTLMLCSLMQKYDVKNMVFSSSATVYGKDNISPLTENLPVCAINPYGRTKIMIEQILKDIYASDNNWSISILRYFNPIGAHESGKIGEDPKDVPNNLMPYLAQTAAGIREKLSIYGGDYETHDGTGVRDYIHVVDLAKGHLKALEKAVSSKEFSVYNLGTGAGYSVLDVVKAFEIASNRKVPYIITNRRPGDIAACYADSSKAYRELGWKAEKSLEDMCRDAWRWQISQINMK